MTPAERQKLYRQRIKEGIVRAWVKLDTEAVESLIQCGALKRELSTNPQAIGDALLNFVASTRYALLRTGPRHVINSSST